MDGQHESLDQPPSSDADWVLLKTYAYDTDSELMALRTELVEAEVEFQIWNSNSASVLPPLLAGGSIRVMVSENDLRQSRHILRRVQDMASEIRNYIGAVVGFCPFDGRAFSRHSFDYFFILELNKPQRHKGTQSVNCHTLCFFVSSWFLFYNKLNVSLSKTAHVFGPTTPSGFKPKSA
jgi:hypothetical protein